MQLYYTKYQIRKPTGDSDKLLLLNKDVKTVHL